MTRYKFALGVFVFLALSGCEQATTLWQEITSMDQAKVTNIPLHANAPVTLRAGNEIVVSADGAVKLSSINGQIILDAPQGISLVSGDAFIKIKNGVVEISAPGGLRTDNNPLSTKEAAVQEKDIEPVVLAYSSPEDVEQSPAAADSVEPATDVTPVDDLASAAVAEIPVRAELIKGGFQIKDSSTDQPRPNVAYRIEVADGRVVRGMTDENGFTQQVYSDEPQIIKLFFE